jgi:hypothetical protein
MGSDRARVSYDPRQQYRSVVMQQGRVQLEADWNEAQEITGEEMRKEALDFVGPSGTPDDGYKVDPDAKANFRQFDFIVERGIMYVGGLRAYLPEAVRYSYQTDWLDYHGDPYWVDLFTLHSQLPSDEFVYLFLREQEVSAVEDPDLKDVALGGPDTAQRTRLLQRFVRVACTDSDCASGLAAAEAKWATAGLHFDPDTMRLQSWSQLMVGFSNQSSNGPCEPQASGGYIAPDNQLIRVQLTENDPATKKPQFLWGFDDASFLYRIDIDPNNPQNLILESAPVDSYHQPAAGQAVEILRAAAELPNGALVAATSGFVVTLDQNYQPGTQSVTLPEGVFLPPEYLEATQSPAAPLFLRVWQQVKIFNSGTATPLGDTGLQVTIEAVQNQPFHLGDFWLFAARPATPGQVYPERYQNGFQFPDGPREWACPLGVIAWNKDQGTLASDCRNQFDNLVDLTRRAQGCCTITVGPNDLASQTLQQVVDRAANITMEVIAATPGSAGNNIAVAITGVNLAHNPPTFDLTVTETDVYSNLTTGSIQGFLGTGAAGSGSQPGLAQILTGSLQNSPQDQTVFFSGGATGKTAQVDLFDMAGKRAFTLQAKSSGADGNLTSATISNAGPASPTSFDLTLVWTKTLKALTLSSFVQQIQSQMSYEISAFAPTSIKSSFPAEGVTTLSGGVDGNPTTGVASVAATGYVFGKPSKICLQAGSYLLPQPLRINQTQSNLTIEACGGGVTISAAGGATGFALGMIQLVGAGKITLRGLTLAMPSSSLFDDGFTLGNLTRVQLLSLRETSLARLQVSIGIRIVECRGVTVEECVFRYPAIADTASSQYFAGIYANADCAQIDIKDNSFQGPADLLAATESPLALPLVYGYVQSSSTTINSAGSANVAGATLSTNLPQANSTVVPSSADDLTFDGNRFKNLGSPIALLVPIGFVRFISNRVDSCITGFAIVNENAFSALTVGTGTLTDQASQQVGYAFFSNALIQNSFTIPAAIPLPQDYQAVRSLTLTPSSPTGTVALVSSATPTATATLEATTPIAPLTVTPAVAATPLVTAPVVTAPVIAAPIVTAPIVTAPVVTPPVAPVAIPPIVTAPVITAPIVTAPVVAPLLKATDLQPFAANILQFSTTNSSSIIVITRGPTAAQLATRIQISGNDINLLPGYVGFAIYIEADPKAAAGLLTMTGNTFLNQSTVPTVWISSVARSAIAGNVVVNSYSSAFSNALSVSRVPVYSIFMLPVTTAGAVTGNIFLGATVLPQRFPLTSPGLEPWSTYNDVR